MSRVEDFKFLTTVPTEFRAYGWTWEMQEAELNTLEDGEYLFYLKLPTGEPVLSVKVYTGLTPTQLNHITWERLPSQSQFVQPTTEEILVMYHEIAPYIFPYRLARFLRLTDVLGVVWSPLMDAIKEEEWEISDHGGELTCSSQLWVYVPEIEETSQFDVEIWMRYQYQKNRKVPTTAVLALRSLRTNLVWTIPFEWSPLVRTLLDRLT